MGERKNADAWVRYVLREHGIQTIPWPDGSWGLLNVPGKWCSVISVLHAGLEAALNGEELPRLVPKEKPKRRRPGHG